MAPVASLRLPRDLKKTSTDLGIGRAWSDAGGIAGEMSKQALGLSRLVTFDNPHASRTLDLDTMVRSLWGNTLAPKLHLVASD